MVKRNNVRQILNRNKSIKEFNKQEILKLYVDTYKGDFFSEDYKERIRNLRNRGYKAFVNEVGHVMIGEKYVICEHIDEITDFVDDLLNDRILNENGDVVRNGYVSIVSQAGKSTAISDKLPVYVASKYGLTTMLVTFSQNLSYEMSDANKRLVKELGKELGIKLAKGGKDDNVKNQKETWSITRKIDNHDLKRKVNLLFKNFTQIEGSRCNVMILDDIINTDSVRTQNGRDLSYVKYTGKLVSRRPEYIIMVGTRYHKDDLYSRILDKEVGLWATKIIPVYREGKKPLGWERGWDETYWERIKIRMGSKFWIINALCDVSGADEGKLNRNIFIEDEKEYYIDDIHRRVIAADGAQSINEGDYTAFICCDILKNGDIVVIDLETHQLTIREGYKKLSEFIERNVNQDLVTLLKVEKSGGVGKEWCSYLVNDDDSVLNKNRNCIKLYGVVRNGNFIKKDGSKNYHVGKKPIRYERNYGQLEYGNFYLSENLDKDLKNILINQVIDFSENMENDDVVDVFMTVIESVFGFRMGCMLKNLGN